MKSSPDSDPVAVKAASVVPDTGANEGRGFRAILRRFKQDLRMPLPGTEELGRIGKIKARFRHLFKRYGWKLIVAIFCYYLIRDSILYIIIPYLIARKLLVD